MGGGLTWKAWDTEEDETWAWSGREGVWCICGVSGLSIFSKIIRRELPAHVVAEDELFIAFLDVAPLREGHTLVVPKKEIDYLFDQPMEVLTGLLPFVQVVVRKIERVVECRRVGLSVVGLEVPHAHMHLIPIDRVSDMDFSRPKLSPTRQALAVLAKAIRQA